MPEALIATSTPASKVNLLGMTRAQLEAFFGEIGEKKFRAQQVMKWMHHQGVRDFQAMTNLGKGLRDRLESCAEITLPKSKANKIPPTVPVSGPSRLMEVHWLRRF